MYLYFAAVRKDFICLDHKLFANVLTGRNSAQCRVGRANYNESKTIRKATCIVVTRSFTLYSDHQTTECFSQISYLIYKSPYDS